MRCGARSSGGAGCHDYGALPKWSRGAVQWCRVRATWLCVPSAVGQRRQARLVRGRSPLLRRDHRGAPTVPRVQHGGRGRRCERNRRSGRAPPARAGLTSRAAQEGATPVRREALEVEPMKVKELRSRLLPEYDDWEVVAETREGWFFTKEVHPV